MRKDFSYHIERYKAMIRISTLLYLVLFYLSICSIQSKAADKNKHSIDDQVKSLLSKMSLEEKIGQMTQLTIQALSVTHGPAQQRGELDIKKVEEAVIKYHVGSILNVYDSSLSIEDWNKLITTIQDIATKRTRLKIPVLYGIDAIHGANYTIGATLFPQALNMAATFNPALVKKEGQITALEVRASGIPWIFYPVMDLGRQPLWSRLYETYAETPGNINDLTLSEAQLKLAKALISTGKPVVLVMFEGRPRIIDQIVHGSKAILIAFLPGMQGGNALANIIFGDVNPSGKLPITYPRYVNALYH